MRKFFAACYINGAGVVSRFKNHEEWRENKEDSAEQGASGAALFKGVFTINEKPKDTFISMKGWSKGVCFINGHNLGRYWHIGPQETLYIPAPFLLKGTNEVGFFCYDNCNIFVVQHSSIY